MIQAQLGTNWEATREIAPDVVITPRPFNVTILAGKLAVVPSMGQGEAQHDSRPLEITGVNQFGEDKLLIPLSAAK